LQSHAALEVSVDYTFLRHIPIIAVGGAMPSAGVTIIIFDICEHL
jgi:hypothetical protein